MWSMLPWNRVAIYGGWLDFFFQAEDGIRDYKVTGVQTCALPICEKNESEIPDEEESKNFWKGIWGQATEHDHDAPWKIGRASCRERV